MGGWRNRNLGGKLEDCLTLLLPVITGMVENVLNELVDPAKISWQHAVSANVLMIKYKKKKCTKEIIFGFQAKS